jgi:hypothetical protein
MTPRSSRFTEWCKIAWREPKNQHAQKTPVVGLDALGNLDRRLLRDAADHRLADELALERALK